MSYESIAKLVHDLVKNPKTILMSDQKTDEFTVIQKVFYEFEASGGATALEILPLGYWG